MSVGNHDEKLSPSEPCLTASPAVSSYLVAAERDLRVSWRRWSALALVTLVVSGVLIANGWLEVAVLGLLLTFIAMIQVIDAHGALRDVRGRQVRFPTTN